MKNQNEEYKFQGQGLSGYEKVKAKKAFDEYCARYHIEAYSDYQMLEELIYREVLQGRLRDKADAIEAKNEKEKKEEKVPRNLVETMNENFNQIMSIKEKLGMFENKQGKDGFDYIQKLKEKFKKWCEENQGSRSLVCPHCSKMILLKIRTEAWEAQKHPFFKDKLLANRKLWQLYKEGKITKQDIAEILGCSDRYVDWLEKKIFQAPAQE